MTKDASSQLPAPHYTLIETSRGKDPAVVAVNSALRRFDGREQFPWHLSIAISCRLLGDKGIPTAEENQILYSLEDKISTVLLADYNAAFLARITCRGERELSYRVRDPETANDQLEQLASSASSRQWEYRMEKDSEWHLAQPELALLERDPKFNLSPTCM